MLWLFAPIDSLLPFTKPYPYYFESKKFSTHNIGPIALLYPGLPFHFTARYKQYNCIVIKDTALISG